mmetsp:Transcript_20704/g.24506  ORF Transcript_20704/g.24506 Transcript_20704/m.24506 type:complete len:392 (+) Transcript_20704:56-1231(+)
MSKRALQDTKHQETQFLDAHASIKAMRQKIAESRTVLNRDYRSDVIEKAAENKWKSRLLLNVFKSWRRATNLILKEKEEARINPLPIEKVDNSTENFKAYGSMIDILHGMKNRCSNATQKLETTHPDNKKPDNKKSPSKHFSLEKETNEISPISDFSDRNLKEEQRFHEQRSFHESEMKRFRTTHNNHYSTPNPNPNHMFTESKQSTQHSELKDFQFSSRKKTQEEPSIHNLIYSSHTQKVHHTPFRKTTQEEQLPQHYQDTSGYSQPYHSSHTSQHHHSPAKSYQGSDGYSHHSHSQHHGHPQTFLRGEQSTSHMFNESRHHSSPPRSHQTPHNTTEKMMTTSPNTTKSTNKQPISVNFFRPVPSPNISDRSVSWRKYKQEDFYLPKASP